jgi:hypothetical protein
MTIARRNPPSSSAPIRELFGFTMPAAACASAGRQQRFRPTSIDILGGFRQNCATFWSEPAICETMVATSAMAIRLVVAMAGGCCQSGGLVTDIQRGPDRVVSVEATTW